MYLIPSKAVSYEREKTLSDYIALYAQIYVVDDVLLTKVGRCESNLQITAKGDSGASTGVWQWQQPTWDRYTKIYNKKYDKADTFDIHSIHDQAKLTAFAFSLGEQTRNEWSCYRHLRK